MFPCCLLPSPLVIHPPKVLAFCDFNGETTTDSLPPLPTGRPVMAQTSYSESFTFRSAIYEATLVAAEIDQQE